MRKLQLSTQRAFHMMMLLSSSVIFFSCNEDKDLPAKNEIVLKLTVIHDQQPVEGEWSVAGKNAAGEVVDNRKGKFENRESSIAVTSGLHKYSFILQADGYQREFDISGESITANSTLMVGLTDSDYYRYTTEDSNVTILLPIDPTNPLVELRVSDPAKIAYSTLERGFWKGNLPVDDVLYRLIQHSEIDNTTFQPLIKFRGGHGDTWDSADALFVYDSYETGYEEIHHVWEE